MYCNFCKYPVDVTASEKENNLQRLRKRRLLEVKLPAPCRYTHDRATKNGTRLQFYETHKKKL